MWALPDWIGTEQITYKQHKINSPWQAQKKCTYLNIVTRFSLRGLQNSTLTTASITQERQKFNSDTTIASYMKRLQSTYTNLHNTRTHMYTNTTDKIIKHLEMLFNNRRPLSNHIIGGSVRVAMG